MKYGAKKDANHCLIVEALTKFGCGIIDLSSLGCGVPDLLVIAHGELHLADVKNACTSYGKRGMSARQLEWAAWWQGSRIFLLYTVDDAKNLACGKLELVKSVVCGFTGLTT